MEIHIPRIEKYLSRLNFQRPFLGQLARGVALAGIAASLTACGPGGVSDELIADRCDQVFRTVKPNDPIFIFFPSRVDQFPVNARFTGINLGVLDEDRHRQRITNDSDANDHHPMASPDGTQVAFVRWGVRRQLPDRSDIPEISDREGIYTVNLDGTNLRALALSRNRNIAYNSPMWSDDGEKIAFNIADTSKPASNGDLAVVSTTDGSMRIPTKDSGVNVFPQRIRFSPDGSKVGFTDYAATYVADLNAGDVKKVSEIQPGTDAEADLFWVDRDNLIVLRTSPIPGREEYSFFGTYVVRADGSSLQGRDVSSVCRHPNPDLDN